MKVSNTQIAVFLAASEKFSEVALDDARGDAHAQLYSEATIKHIAYQYRAKALEKERARILSDHAQKTARGEIKYGESPDGDPAKRPVLFRDQRKAEVAFGAWHEKMEALNVLVVDLNAAPLKDDFFSKPAEIEVKQGVRIGFLPFMAKYQSALKANSAPKKKAKR